VIKSLREKFNAAFSKESYEKQRKDLEARVGVPIEFRTAETPLFIPYELAQLACNRAEEILVRATSPELQQIGRIAIPAAFNIAEETSKPLFAAIDFAITGSIDQPKLQLIELQGFPSLFYFQPCFSLSMQESYGLPTELDGLLNHQVTLKDYYNYLEEAILEGNDPNEVILLEIDPYEQKTLPDFLLTQKHLGIPIVNIRDVTAHGKELFYTTTTGELRKIKRIYNRAIYDELYRKQVTIPFDTNRSYDITWAGHPNWYYRISKILLPYLSGLNDAIPATHFLNKIDFHHLELEQYVLKPLYSFAGRGVIIGPPKEDIEAIPHHERNDWILQERVEYCDVIHTPDGNGVKAELRVLLLWPEANDLPVALHSLIRLSRGKMMGVDFNKGLDWVGSSCGLVEHTPNAF